ncbi:HK97 gp10 family phage protein [Priestia aryabhattai]|uniref:HK97-gp10 family putative phage morphogenesis protein n=1 Tax=Priestia aryabhattai TaxID=412384 RepID=UPI00234E872B|nr:HK97-gp10 family putative phage morphogenesis protein [Priestia aryabhattai]MDC7762475.1 HK97 gp10 family phage protein [Priestia aryabhattai]
MPVKSTGLAEFQAKLRKLASIEQNEAIAEKALRTGAEILRAEIERRAPRSTYKGKHLADHVIISNIVNGKIKVGFHKDFFYARFLEWGTSKMPAQPFIEPAFNAVKGRVINAMVKVYRRELAKL